MDYIKTLAQRRSVYALSNIAQLSDDILAKEIGEIVSLTPSAFHSEAQRAVLLFGEKHKLLWEIVLSALRPMVPAADFPRTEAKVAAFAAGRGTILYFEDMAVIQELQTKYPLYKSFFSTWSIEQNAMLQINLWQYLVSVGYGASLQHYSNLIESEVKRVFDFPSSWQLRAEMPFGTPVQMPPAKPKLAVDQRFRVLR